jgi:hypothetical protein
METDCCNVVNGACETIALAGAVRYERQNCQNCQNSGGTLCSANAWRSRADASSFDSTETRAASDVAWSSASTRPSAGLPAIATARACSAAINRFTPCEAVVLTAAFLTKPSVRSTAMPDLQGVSVNTSAPVASVHCRISALAGPVVIAMKAHADNIVRARKC